MTFKLQGTGICYFKTGFQLSNNMEDIKQEIGKVLRKIKKAKDARNKEKELFYIGVYLGISKSTKIHYPEWEISFQEQVFEEKAKTLMQSSSTNNQTSSIPLVVFKCKETFSLVKGNSKIIETLCEMISGPKSQPHYIPKTEEKAPKSVLLFGKVLFKCSWQSQSASSFDFFLLLLLLLCISYLCR